MPIGKQSGSDRGGVTYMEPIHLLFLSSSLSVKKMPTKKNEKVS